VAIGDPLNLLRALSDTAGVTASSDPAQDSVFSLALRLIQMS
jgi:hypothetical protein